jgi:KTSC domain
MITWIDVDSRAVAAIAYDPDDDAIYVRFHSGVEWRYRDCSPAEWEELRSPSTSKGKYLNEVLKQKPAERLD